ncbi:MAG TPA: hypothetical protein VFT18_01200 [Gaiellaceae bacterium]|nr:hypothetical protein [Gaiellaceae bacterium]
MRLGRRLAYFAASLPERLVRSTAAVLGGTVHETAELLLPRIARRSRLYEASAKNLLRILIEGVGDVDRPGRGTVDPTAPAPKELALRKGAGNIVEFGSIAAFGFSPLWILAAVADLTHGSRVYLESLTDELKASGVVTADLDVSSVDELLGVLEGTSGRTARLIDIPPVELAELRATLRELGAEATDLPSQEQLARLYDGLRRTAAAEDRSLLEVSQGIGMAFLTSARKLSNRHVKVPYREDWRPLHDEGFAAYAARVSRPYGEAAASHFNPERRSYTERVLDRIPAGDDATSFEFCDEFEDAFGWLAHEKLRRTSHAVKSRGEVWVFDPVRWEPALQRIRELGEPAGVVQLLDRHPRDCAAVASALGVPHYNVPIQGIAASPLEIVPLARSRFWKEVAAWVPELRALVVADALGTVGYFRAPEEPIGVHPFLRLKPPRVLGSYEPRHVLCGHGAGIHGEGAAEAVREALRTARRRLPKAWLGVFRSG